MKNLKKSYAAKLIAVILLCASAILCVASAGGAFALYEAGAYGMSYDAAAGRMLDGIGSDMCRAAAAGWRTDSYEGSARPANFRCVIFNAEGEEVYSDYEGEDALWEKTMTVPPEYFFWSEERGAASDAGAAEAPEETPVPTLQPGQGMPAPVPTAAPAEDGTTVWVLREADTDMQHVFSSIEEKNQWVRENSLRVHGYILRDITEGDAVWQRLHFFSTFYRLRTLLPVPAVLSFLFGVLLFLFLLSAAGRHRDEEGVRESFVDRIPFDLFTLLIVCAEALVISGIVGPGWDFEPFGVTAVTLLSLLAGLIFLLWCMSLAVRVRCGTVWSNNLVLKILRWLARLLKKLAVLLSRGLTALPLLWRWAAVLAGLMFVEFICLAASRGRGTLLFLLHLFVLCPALLYVAWQFRKLRTAAHEIAQGATDVAVDTKGMLPEFREHAEDLGTIRDGVNAAVEERLKSERFRAELITNVSHDLKTPLTSLISYVDLLGKEELNNETAKGYVEVLSRQAERLKKLTEDLVEASKASTGSLPVVQERLDLGVLLDQAAGEYAGRMEKAQLELLCSKPEHEVPVICDGRHMWRIFDNLMGNIVKYAQPGTRVYVDLEEKGQKAEITFRNISRSRLNVSGEELAERFVRGDASRSAEGSGLGLSIAMSLAKLQKGEMRIDVDGDLFKVTLLFDKAE